MKLAHIVHQRNIRCHRVAITSKAFFSGKLTCVISYATWYSVRFVSLYCNHCGVLPWSWLLFSGLQWANCAFSSPWPAIYTACPPFPRGGVRSWPPLPLVILDKYVDHDFTERPRVQGSRQRVVQQWTVSVWLFRYPQSRASQGLPQTRPAGGGGHLLAIGCHAT